MVIRCDFRSSPRNRGASKKQQALILLCAALAPLPDVSAIAEESGKLVSIDAMADRLSPMAMFLHADIVVQFVIAGLGLASLSTWTVVLLKTAEIGAGRRHLRRAFEALSEGGSLRDACSRLDSRQTIGDFAAAALAEAELSQDLPKSGIKERAELLLMRLNSRVVRRLNRGTGILASVGSTAPFIGLFGTVWGIMNSFIGIAKSNTTNLAVVAPGIAEALLATAIGLIAAIPAVVAYNVFARSIASYRASLEDATGEILRRLSRDLDRSAGTAQSPSRVDVAMEK